MIGKNLKSAHITLEEFERQLSPEPRCDPFAQTQTISTQTDITPAPNFEEDLEEANYDDDDDVENLATVVHTPNSTKCRFRTQHQHYHVTVLLNQLPSSNYHPIKSISFTYHFIKPISSRKSPFSFSPETTKTFSSVSYSLKPLFFRHPLFSV